MSETATTTDGPEEDESRRDFLLIATSTMGAVGTAIGCWPLLDSLNPSADVLALASTEVDLAPIKLGQSITIKWRGKPVFIRRRTADEIAAAKKDDEADLPHPEADAKRAKKAEWLVMVGICTHLGCIPAGQKPGESKGDFGGWFCPCHGSHYDTSGRIRKGPAPENLLIPPYSFLTDTTIKIG
ncbi:MAG TPA: ubiquinol-cytochrome c reductase iron-sulfur subunit [Rhodospirillales bacterium]|jgi:ubiquinol-cytochrome c reductase iron-sulfur subunit|nr:ubiquinol-cytochrome c reductase iron-sulfur subunit [Rhodospirillales bacterium]|tara:strand:- start:93 stop:644 length:552 start_codon:yes stop_codon:yes gene_type:complete